MFLSHSLISCAHPEVSKPAGQDTQSPPADAGGAKSSSPSQGAGGGNDGGSGGTAKRPREAGGGSTGSEQVPGSYAGKARTKESPIKTPEQPMGGASGSGQSSAMDVDNEGSRGDGKKNKAPKEAAKAPKGAVPSPTIEIPPPLRHRSTETGCYPLRITLAGSSWIAPLSGYQPPPYRALPAALFMALGGGTSGRDCVIPLSHPPVPPVLAASAPAALGTGTFATFGASTIGAVLAGTALFGGGPMGNGVRRRKRLIG